MVHIDPAGMVEIDELPNEVKPADVILVSHPHTDHCDPDVIRAISKPNTVVIGPGSCVQELHGFGLKVADIGDAISVGDVHISAVAAYNVKQGGSSRKLHHKGFGLGYVVRVGDISVYHAGDTDYIPEMRSLGPVTVACLPVGGVFTMDAHEAVQSLRDIRPTLAIPIHCFPMDARAFASQASHEASQVRVIVPEIGYPYQLG